MQTDNMKLYDVYGVWYRPFWQEPWFLVVAIIIGVICIGICSFIIYKRYFAVKPVVAVDEEVLKSIALLQTKNAESKSEIKVIYFQATALLKKYLSFRYDLQLVSATDDELLSILKEKTSKRVVEIFQRLLDAIIKVKFADYTAQKKELKENLEAIKTIIIETRVVKDKKG